MELRIIFFILAGLAALFSCLYTFYQIRLHVLYNSYSIVRRYIIRILLMIVIYSIESWFGLRYKDASHSLSFIRDCYESVVIYSFFQLLVALLGGDTNVKRILYHYNSDTNRESESEETMHNGVPHLYPLSLCFNPWSGTKLYNRCKYGILQYVVIKIFVSILAFILSFFDLYIDGDLSMSNSYLYLSFITTISQSYSLYCLVIFYICVHSPLDYLNPLNKFLTIKGIVFLTYWQSVLIAILVYFGLIPRTHTYSIDNIASGTQDFLICIEMIGFSIMHNHAFSYTEFQEKSEPLLSNPALVYSDEARSKSPFFRSVIKTMTPIDIINDMKEFASSFNDVEEKELKTFENNSDKEFYVSTSQYSTKEYHPLKPVDN